MRPHSGQIGVRRFARLYPQSHVPTERSAGNALNHAMMSQTTLIPMYVSVAGSAAKNVIGAYHPPMSEAAAVGPTTNNSARTKGPRCRQTARIGESTSPIAHPIGIAMIAKIRAVGSPRLMPTTASNAKRPPVQIDVSTSTVVRYHPRTPGRRIVTPFSSFGRPARPACTACPSPRA